MPRSRGAHRGLQNLLGLLSLCGALAANAQSTAELQADCNADSHYRVLEKSPLSLPAQALWLDAHRLRWPDAPENAQVTLLASTTGHIDSEIGAVPSLELQRIPLVRTQAAAPDPRFVWFGEGAEFALPAVGAAAADSDGAASLGDLLRGALLVAALDEQGRVLAQSRIHHAAALDALYADSAQSVKLGAIPTMTGSRFALWAPTAHSVAVCVHANVDQPTSTVQALGFDESSGVWSTQVDAAEAGSYYRYLVDVWVPGQGLVRNRVTDPYALGLSADSQLAMVVDLDDARFKPAGWDRHARPDSPEHNVDMVLYELHVRDFTRDDASVAPELRGRYLGFTATDSLGVRHLREMANAGLTDVHLLPAYDISSIPETDCLVPVVAGPPDGEQQQALIGAVKHRDCFNWGYDPQHYTVPEGSYASDARDGAVRIREFRQMVMALHAMGLRVGMDVVYNHTSHAGQHARSVLDRIVPGYYHRLNREGEIERSTCCENTATEHRMMAKLMIDSAVVWVRDYAIDGFRFDLMGHQPKAVMLELMQQVDAAAGRRIPLIGEGWNFGEVADGARFEQASQLSLAGSGIATFSDRARDALRGGGAATAGDELRTALGWLHARESGIENRESESRGSESRDSGFGIRDSEEHGGAAPRSAPLSPGGRGVGGEGATRGENGPPLPNPSPTRGEGLAAEGPNTAEPALPAANPESRIPNPGFIHPESRIPNPGSSNPESPIPNPALTTLVKVGLAGSLRDYEMLNPEGELRPLSQVDYSGQPAGYVASPNEVVNYVENHDNQTLYDINALRLPQDTPEMERARVQLLGAAVNLLSQGIPYFHAGVEVLRSKSLDRNSYDSGDHFNRLDYSGADNGFGRGLPPAWDNQRDWPSMRDLLADPALKPSVETVDFMRRGFLDWLQLRAQTPLLRLASADEIERRLSFLPTPAGSGLIAALIDGEGHASSPHRAVLYALNPHPSAAEFELPIDIGSGWRLHPALAEGADSRVRAARLDANAEATGARLSLPGRTAAVWVR
jgi:pullulanase/glycogen debranching enzyme